MASLTKVQRAAEQARKKRVDAYKKEIAQMEEDSELFYENQLKRGKISNEDFAYRLKERSQRYSDYAQEVLTLSYMTNEESYDLSREYMQKSEKALTEHMEKIKKLEREKLNSSLETSMQYLYDRNYYADWEHLGDDPIEGFERVDKKLSESYFAGTISRDEYEDRIKGAGSAIYEDRIANSNRWLAHESEMNRLTAEEYIAGLYRMRKYTTEYYDKGIISKREYLDNMQSLEERIFAKRKEQHREILRQAEEEKDAIDTVAQAKIDALKDEYNAAIADMDKKDLNEELSLLTAQERIYANSQTREGKERLAEIREDIADINDEKRRIALKEDLQYRTDVILSNAEYQKTNIDRRAASSALDLGLYYDKDTGYKMLRHVTAALGNVFGEQQSFSAKSAAEANSFNLAMTSSLTDTYKSFSAKILENFQEFAKGVAYVKEQISKDVASVNSIGSSKSTKSSGKTSITYNDYGDKNITNTNSGMKVADLFKNVIAKGLKL